MAHLIPAVSAPTARTHVLVVKDEVLVKFRSIKVTEFGHENRWIVVRHGRGGNITIGDHYASRTAAEEEVLKLNQHAASTIMRSPHA